MVKAWALELGLTGFAPNSATCFMGDVGQVTSLCLGTLIPKMGLISVIIF